MKITQILEEEERIKTSRFAAGTFIARYQRTGSIADAQRTVVEGIPFQARRSRGGWGG